MNEPKVKVSVCDSQLLRSLNFSGDGPYRLNFRIDLNLGAVINFAAWYIIEPGSSLACLDIWWVIGYTCNLLNRPLFTWQVDLTAYTERHEFVFDAVLNQQVSNDEVRKSQFGGCAYIWFMLGFDMERTWMRIDSMIWVCRCIVPLWNPLYPLSSIAQRQPALLMDKQVLQHLTWKLISCCVSLMRCLLKAFMCEVKQSDLVD